MRLELRRYYGVLTASANKNPVFGVDLEEMMKIHVWTNGIVKLKTSCFAGLSIR
jgi:hypothetical protein